MQEEWDGNTERMPKKYIDESKDTPKKFNGVSLITSKRTFGVELEMFGGQRDPLRTFCSNNGHALMNDGSIRDNKGNHGGQEVASKVFSGEKGALELMELTELSKASGFMCNYSTGTHIHLDAKDFYSRDKFTQRKISELSKFKGHDMLLVESALYNKMRRSLSPDTIFNKYFLEGFISARANGSYTSSYIMEDGRTSYICIVPCYYLGNKYYIMCRTSVLQEQLNLKVQSLANRYQILNITDKDTTLSRDEYGKETATMSVGKISLFTKTPNAEWTDLKTLFAFYVYFDDLLFGMLPPSRKNSIYAVPLSQNYLLKQVLKADSQTELEKLWYGSNDIERIENMKEERKHISRRSAINLHSIFNRHCTLEVRSHHGTLNGHSILGWVALHQRIMDRIKLRSFDYRMFDGMNTRASLAEKLEYFTRALALEGDLLEFVKNRLQNYN